MSLSVIIPVKNEEKNITNTCKKLKFKLAKANIDFEIIIIDDFSEDKTIYTIKKIKNRNIHLYKNIKLGVGNAIKLGILKSTKKYICFFMSDESDYVSDLVNYYMLISKNNYDAIFGSRFLSESKIENYPIIKFILNRIFNKFVQLIFFSSYNDFTNAFKIYNKKKILKIFPFESKKFDIFLEIPLKFYIKKYNFKIIPICWKGRKKGLSKFIIKELSLNYIKILIKCVRLYYLSNKRFYN